MLTETTEICRYVYQQSLSKFEKIQMLFGKVYKHAMKYPPFAYVVNLIQDWVKLSKNLVTHVLQDYHTFHSIVQVDFFLIGDIWWVENA